MKDLKENELVEQAYKILEQAYNKNSENSFSVFSVVTAKDYRDKSKSSCHTMILGSTRQLLAAFHNIFENDKDARRFILKSMLPMWLILLLSKISKRW